MKIPAIIIDLDGTLCNDKHREHMYHSQLPKDEKWEKINEACMYDLPNLWCAEIVKLFAMNGYHILYVTGRSETARECTAEWLMRNIGPLINSELLMRPKNTEGEAPEIKRNIYLTHIAPTYDVTFCIDNEERNCTMWKDLGLTALLCD